MKVLMFEHICSGGLAGHPLDDRLMSKGGAMLRALVEDFAAAGYDVTTLLDSRVPYALPGRIIRVDPRDPEAGARSFDAALADVDAAMVVAPEFGGLLSGWLERVERAGVQNLGSSSRQLAQVTDKFRMGELLRGRSVRTPVGERGLGNAMKMIARFGQIVVKPNEGAGCIDTFVCRDGNDLARLPARQDWLVQERVQGIAASVAFIVRRDGRQIPLRAGQQLIDDADGTDGFRLNYSGGQMPMPLELETRAIELGRRALEHFPLLNGCVGLDLVMGQDVTQDCVIEINPRPTVAYVGLRSLAKAWLPDVITGATDQMTWRDGRVKYFADGTVTAAD